MNFKILLAASILLTGLFLTSCKKDELDSEKPVITITSPAKGAELERGKTYPVTGTVTDDTELAEIVVGSITITQFDTPTSHEIKNISLPIDSSAVPGGAVFIVTAKDKAGNESTETITFTIK